MLGGVGLAIATADVEGVALATGGFGRTHPPSVKPTRVLSARRPMDAPLISPPLAPAGLWSWPKLATQFYVPDGPLAHPGLRV